MDSYGVYNNKLLEPAFEATRVNILKLRGQGLDIAPILNGFDDAKLVAWNSNVNNVAFREFFESSVSQASIEAKLTKWSNFVDDPGASSIVNNLSSNGFGTSEIFLSYATYTSKFAIADDLALGVFKIEGFAELVLNNHTFIKAIELTTGSNVHTINGIQYSNLSEAFLDVLKSNGKSFLDNLIIELEMGISVVGQAPTTGNIASTIAGFENSFINQLKMKEFNDQFVISYFSAGIFNSTVYPTHIGLSMTDLNALKVLGDQVNGGIGSLGTKNYAKITIGNTSFNGTSGTSGINNQSSIFTNTFNTPLSVVRTGDSEVKALHDILESGLNLNGKTIIIESMRPVCPSCKNVIKALESDFDCTFIIKEGKFPPL